MAQLCVDSAHFVRTDIGMTGQNDAKEIEYLGSVAVFATVVWNENKGMVYLREHGQRITLDVARQMNVIAPIHAHLDGRLLIGARCHIR